MNRFILAGYLPLLWCLPLKNLHLTSGFGYRLHPLTGRYAFHRGVDLRALNDPVYAVLDGIVSGTGYDRSLGIYIRLDHGDFQSLYGHLSQFFVSPGDTVQAGEVIAFSGATGRVTGPHLHFGIAFHHRNIDPLTFLMNIQKLNQYKEIKQ
jgi:murein DD-endopeptidase MepM/ murein hydrolase activator NlpD